MEFIDAEAVSKEEALKEVARHLSVWRKIICRKIVDRELSFLETWAVRPSWSV